MSWNPRSNVAAYLAFAIFGAFWGTWGASIPAVRAQTGISDGRLGAALLFIGAGALPAMLVAGCVVDRWGHRTAAVTLVALGIAGIIVAVSARDVLTLSIGLAIVGATSGAADVAINALAGSAQQATGRPVISRAHAIFSAAVVATSLSTGVSLGAGAPLPVIYGALAVVATLGATVVVRASPAVVSPPGPATGSAALTTNWTMMRLLLALGGLGALVFAVENGHENWSALYYQDVLGAGPAIAALGPAIFAAVVAITRVTTAELSTRYPITVLTSGSLTAAVGTTLVGVATSLTVGLLGLGLAAAGTAVLLPVLLSVLAAHVPERSRGAATSIFTTIAYLGFLIGPVYFGYWSEAAGLPGAMLALAGLATTLVILSPLTRWLRPSSVPAPECTTSKEPAQTLPGPHTTARQDLDIPEP
ncbi:MFS transporter [Kocuria salina]|uniref:MFS transporter n=1 Tax=Kocuria salina TaxID=1929416 RepID=UPI0015942B76|nr:MFS transporter [Kocuria salina]NVC25322.1 MFS transporter [Kocuria salina]